MIKKFLSATWVELVALVLLDVGLLRWVVPMCINARDDDLLLVALACWITVPIITLWVLVDMLRRWLRLSQSLRDLQER